MATVQLQTRDGSTLPAHRDVLGLICKEAAQLAEVEAEAAADPAQPSLAGLSLITRQFDEATVRCFLAEVYICSGAVEGVPAGVTGMQLRWNNLSQQQQADVVRLADMLNAAAVLQSWDNWLADQAEKTSAALDLAKLGLWLLDVDRYQCQLPKRYAAAMAGVCQRVQANQIAIEVVSQQAGGLSQRTCAALLSTVQLRLSNVEQKLAVEAASHAETKLRLASAEERAKAATATVEELQRDNAQLATVEECANVAVGEERHQLVVEVEHPTTDSSHASGDMVPRCLRFPSVLQNTWEQLLSGVCALGYTISESAEKVWRFSLIGAVVLLSLIIWALVGGVLAIVGAPLIVLVWVGPAFVFACTVKLLRKIFPLSWLEWIPSHWVDRADEFFEDD